MRDYFPGLEYSILNIKKYISEEIQFESIIKNRNEKGLNSEFENIHFFYQNTEINSVITFFIPYMTSTILNNTGNISMYARGIDYHLIIREKMEKIVNDMRSDYPDNFFNYQCDVGHYNERFYAGLSGLCIIGKNGSLIHPLYGSYGNLALIFTDRVFDEKVSEVKHCNNCMKCKLVCPTKSISENFESDANVCISYITQKKGNLTVNEERWLRDSSSAFGCDICQRVCPYNDSVKLIETWEKEIENLELDMIEGLSNKKFVTLYKNRAFSWRGKATILRNLKIIKGE